MRQRTRLLRSRLMTATGPGTRRGNRPRASSAAIVIPDDCPPQGIGVEPMDAHVRIEHEARGNLFVVLALVVAACSPAGPAVSVPEANTPTAGPPSGTAASATQEPSGQPLVSISGRLFLGRLAGNVEHYVTLADGVERELFQAEGCHPCVWPSNDGRSFGHPAPFGTGSAAIIVDTSTSTEMEVPRTADGVFLGSGPWSPDDKRLVRGAWHETDASKRGLWAAAIDGSGARQLTVNPDGTQHEPLAWSPVGDQILYFVETNGSVTSGASRRLGASRGS